MPCVYVLFSTEDPESIRYVGRSKHDSHEKRLKVHLASARNGSKSHVHNWIRKTTNAGNQVLGITLETGLSWNKSARREVYYINKYKKQGHSLTNMSDGGEGRGIGYKLSEDARKSIGRHNHLLKKKQHEDYRKQGIIWGKDIGPKKRIPEEVVDYIRKRYNEGESLHGIARELNAKGILSGYGKKWSASSVKYVVDRY